MSAPQRQLGQQAEHTQMSQFCARESADVPHNMHERASLKGEAPQRSLKDFAQRILDSW